MEIVCCVCRKVKIGNNWVKKKDVDFESASHGYCPACYGRTLAIIREMNNPQLDKRVRAAI
jgi:hypothetical protein